MDERGGYVEGSAVRHLQNVQAARKGSTGRECRLAYEKRWCGQSLQKKLVSVSQGSSYTA